MSKVRELRPYQHEAVKRAVAGNLYLAGRPGSGKTAIAILAAHELLFGAFKVDRVLVVAPKRVVPQIASEAVSWGVKGLAFAEATGPEEKRLAAIQSSANVVVTQHEHFPWLVKQFKRGWPFGFLVYDEASRLRNGGRQGSAGWKSVSAVREHCQILLMSGSPRPGTAHELYAPVALLDGGQRLGKTLSGFRSAYLEPNKTDRNSGRVFNWKLREGMEEALYGKIADLYYGIDPDLGLEYEEVDVWVDLPKEVDQQCKRMLRQMVAEFGKDQVTASSRGVAAGKWHQMLSGSVFNDKGGVTHIHDRHLQALKGLLDQPTVVVYWYTHEFERIKKEFPEAVDLSTKEGLSAAMRGDVKVALLHPQSAGHGIDGLQKHFSRMVFYTLPYSYEYYDQTLARVVRHGQGEKVKVFRIMSDIRVVDMLRRKQEDQDEFYEFLMT
jgi:hypothetical protein